MMTRIRPEPALALSAPQEAAVLRAAAAHNPDLRVGLAVLLNQLDAFGEVIDLLADCDGHEGLLALAAAHFGRSGPGDTQAAEAAALRALEAASNDRERAAALAEQGKALLRRGEDDSGAVVLNEALGRDPHNIPAFRRLSTLLLDLGDADGALALIERLRAARAIHVRLLGAEAKALAMLGRIDEARETVGLERFSYHETLPPPPGWDSLDAFNAALAEELLARTDLRHDRHGTASIDTWRIDAPTAGDAPLARIAMAWIAAAAERHVAALPGGDHPWLAARPAEAELRSWCVITEGAGHETWHMHPAGWMSGGYYVAVPDAVADGEGEAGCLAFGLPGGLAGEDKAAAYGIDLMRPRAGSLTLFPSHAFHRTFPHRAAGRRICIAFDIMPI